MDIENMSQKQLDNIKRILKLANKSIFNLNNITIKKYVYEFLANFNNEVIETICILIDDNKIKSINDINKFVNLLETASKHSDKRYAEGLPTCSTYQFASSTLIRHIDHPNINLLMEIMSGCLSYERYKDIYETLISNDYFLNDKASIYKLIDYVKECTQAQIKRKYRLIIKNDLRFLSILSDVHARCVQLERESERAKSIEEVKKLQDKYNRT